MRGRHYYTTLLILILGFVCVVVLLSNLGMVLFIKQLYIQMLFLILASFGLFSIRNNLRHTWIYMTLLYAALIGNLLYLLLSRSTGTLGYILFLATFTVFFAGFVISISSIRHCRTGRRHRRRPGQKPKIIIEDLPQPKKSPGGRKKKSAAVRRSGAKKASKTPKAKTAKSSSAGKKKPGRKKKPGPKPKRKG